jgi:hypothetical protein
VKIESSKLDDAYLELPDSIIAADHMEGFEEEEVRSVIYDKGHYHIFRPSRSPTCRSTTGLQNATSLSDPYLLSVHPPPTKERTI